MSDEQSIFLIADRKFSAGSPIFDPNPMNANSLMVSSVIRF